MKKLLLLGASALLLSTLMPQEADAQGRRHGVRHGHGHGPRVMAVRPGRHIHRHHHRRGIGVGPAIGLGILGAAAVGAAVAAPHYGYGYADPCLRQQQVVDGWGNAYWQTVRVC